MKQTMKATTLAAAALICFSSFAPSAIAHPIKGDDPSVQGGKNPSGPDPSVQGGKNPSGPDPEASNLEGLAKYLWNLFA